MSRVLVPCGSGTQSRTSQCSTQQKSPGTGPDTARLTRARLAPAGSLAARLDGEDERPVIRTLADLHADPERLIDTADIVRIGLVGSYGALRRWVTTGGLPNPYRLSGGRLAWQAGDVLKATEPAPDKPCAGLAAQEEKLPPIAMAVNNAARSPGFRGHTMYEVLARGDINGVRAGRRTLVLTESLRAVHRKPAGLSPNGGPRSRPGTPHPGLKRQAGKGRRSGPPALISSDPSKGSSA